jgi:hypothetical protein
MLPKIITTRLLLQIKLYNYEAYLCSLLLSRTEEEVLGSPLKMSETLPLSYMAL